MTIQELFVTANKALAAVVAQIDDSQWSLALPAGTSTSPTTLDAAVRYHIYDDAWVPDVLAGKTTAEVGEVYDTLRTTARDLIKQTYAEYNQRATDAVSVFDDLDMSTHLSYGDYPARDYLQHITSFRAFRSYDLGKLIGADTTMDPLFVQGLWDEFSPVVEFYRQLGVFPPAMPVADDADLQTRLLAMVGRS